MTKTLTHEENRLIGFYLDLLKVRHAPERGPLPRIIDDKPVEITRHEFPACPLFFGLVAYPVAELGDLLAEFAEGRAVPAREVGRRRSW